MIIQENERNGGCAFAHTHVKQCVALNNILITVSMKNNNREEFKVRTYGRTELALLYSPELTPESAFKRLKRWIAKSPKLSAKFLVDGKLRSTARSFTPAQVKLIVENLGEP